MRLLIVWLTLAGTLLSGCVSAEDKAAVDELVAAMRAVPGVTAVNGTAGWDESQGTSSDVSIALATDLHGDSLATTLEGVRKVCRESRAPGLDSLMAEISGATTIGRLNPFQEPNGKVTLGIGCGAGEIPSAELAQRADFLGTLTGPGRMLFVMANGSPQLTAPEPAIVAEVLTAAEADPDAADWPDWRISGGEFGKDGASLSATHVGTETRKLWQALVAARESLPANITVGQLEVYDTDVSRVDVTLVFAPPVPPESLKVSEWGDRLAPYVGGLRRAFRRVGVTPEISLVDCVPATDVPCQSTEFWNSQRPVSQGWDGWSPK